MFRGCVKIEDHWSLHRALQELFGFIIVCRFWDQVTILFNVIIQSPCFSIERTSIRYNKSIDHVNRVGSVMVSVLASSAVDHGFETRSGQTKDYKIGICCFCAKHAALRIKNKDWSARNQNNASEWRDMSTRGL